MNSLATGITAALVSGLVMYTAGAKAAQLDAFTDNNPALVQTVDGQSMSTTGATHVHLAFQAADRASVDRFHAAALAAGGKDHGKPGVRVEYHPGYYGAFVIDPDGNNIEAVYHGEADRSAESVVISFRE